MRREATCWECTWWSYNGSGQEGFCSQEEEMVHQDYSCLKFSPINGNIEDFIIEED